MMKSKSNGFTLVELLIVIVVMGALGFLFTDIMTQTLRGQNKTRVMNQVKQNGQVVLDKLNSDIRQAQEIKCVSSDGNVIIYTKLVSGQTGFTRIKFIAPIGQDNGKLVIDYPAVVKNLSETYDPCTAGDISPQNQQNLTDTDPVNGVSINNVDAQNIPFPVFTRSLTSSATDPNDLISDTVTINFNITAGVNAGFAYETTVKEGDPAKGGINYSTTIQLRDLR